MLTIALFSFSNLANTFSNRVNIFVKSCQYVKFVQKCCTQIARQRSSGNASFSLAKSSTRTRSTLKLCAPFRVIFPKSRERNELIAIGEV
jgi:hypothetical protein